MWLGRLCCLGISVLLASQVLADTCKLKAYGTLPAEMIDGQATTLVKINGNDTRLALDTGAFFNAMSSANALSLGLKLRYFPDDIRIYGIGGGTGAHLTTVAEFGILNTTLKNIDFVVGGTDMGYGLLGANLLDSVDLDIDLAHGKLTLFKAEHCDKRPLAYWSKDGNYDDADMVDATNHQDQRTFINVLINGKQVRALLDSGAYATLLSRRAAERVGIDLNAADVEDGGSAIGIGGKPVKAWIVRIDTFSVGTETIQHSQMEVIDGVMGDDETDMLLGVDFLLAHHMYIANSQRKIYFTYNGGRVFSLAKAPGDSDKPEPRSVADNNGAAPKSGSDYALRGEAHLSRGEPKAAVADLDEAIRLAPGQAAYYLARAQAHAADNQSDAALADVDQSLRLDPKNVDALLWRADFRFAHKDSQGALADGTAASALTTAGSTQQYAIAQLYIQLDQPGLALPLLDDWIPLHGNDAMLGSALNERCRARSLSNQMLEDALKDCLKAIKRDGKGAAYLDSLGMVQLRLGRYPESISSYQQAVAQDPDSAWPRYGLGLAEIRNGQTGAGHADLLAARALDPDIEASAIKFGLTATPP